MKEIDYIFETAALISPDQINNKILDEHDYHYYLIVTSDVYYIKNCYLKDDKIAILISNDLDDIEIMLPKKNNYHVKSVSFKYINRNKENIKIRYSCILSDENIEEYEFECNANSLYYYFAEQKKFKIEYIGQSYGNDGHRKAQQRLSSHSTLQNILIKYNNSLYQRNVMIILLGAYMSIIEEYPNINNSNIYQIVSPNLSDSSDYINLLEAFLINYFKPEFNSNYIDNVVPSKKHKSYKKVLNEKFDYFKVIVGVQDSKFDYHFYTNSKCIEISKGVIKDRKEIKVSFNEANQVIVGEFTYSFIK